ncbi:FAD-dependent oxidoreductase [Clostridium mediterraneense]|uniref:FAD-dependent oxidoreductase n=1 Tax=Clostridium mediterraneense TaxID=1805472 RepID=UPI0008330479|nr:FAD-dependent oxidoreductase [Clostridium mediterraneense]
MKVLIIGGGWAGVAAAIEAKKIGADVEIFEKTDFLLGLGNVGGIMRNNGRYTAAEELKAMGAGELIDICDKLTRHKDIEFPGHKHAWLYDANLIEGEVARYIKELGIIVHSVTRIIDIKLEDKKIIGLIDSEQNFYPGDVFIETTGSTGPMGNCLRYGNGCAMCVLRCPSFGPRISISNRCGIEDIQGEREGNELGAFSGSCKLAKETLSEEIQNELNTKGVVILKIPEEDINYDKLNKKVCQQYALKEFAENLVLLDTGDAKLMTTYYPLDKLRKIKGLENAKYIDPYAGGKGNSVRYLSVAPRTNDMRVKGVDNLFCAGEKSGLFVGHTEAIVTGTLAGYNAVRQALGMPLLILPSAICTGDIISYANSLMDSKAGRMTRFTFAGSVFFNRMIEKNLYTIDTKEIENRIKKLNLENIFFTKLI